MRRRLNPLADVAEVEPVASGTATAMPIQMPAVARFIDPRGCVALC